MPLVAVDVFMRTGDRVKVVCTRCKHRYAKSYARAYHPQRVNLKRLAHACRVTVMLDTGEVTPFSDGWSWTTKQRGIYE